MQPAPQFCKERKILEGRHRADLKIYLDAVGRLERSLGEEFERAYRYAERARLACEESRIALQDHITTHRCGAADAAEAEA
jgi:hypothetical protein